MKRNFGLKKRKEWSKLTDEANLVELEHMLRYIKIKILLEKLPECEERTHG